MSSGEFLISAQGGQGLPWGPRSPGWGVGWGGIGSGRTRYKAGFSHQWPVPHSIQNLAKYKVKEEEHWTRLRRYSLLLQKEDLKK